MTVKTFIDRPILAGVISVLIIILGILGLLQLPIEQFPNIAPPTVRVSATYTGANALVSTKNHKSTLKLLKFNLLGEIW